MRRSLLIAFTATALSGCALWDAYFMAPYDANEYMLITEIRTNAALYREQCANPVLAPVNAQAMANRTLLYERYEENIPRNENGYKAARALNEISQGLSTAYAKGSVSPTFCKLKYNNIEHSAELIQRVTAGRPRK
jgi:hypothetical protein